MRCIRLNWAILLALATLRATNAQVPDYPDLLADIRPDYRLVAPESTPWAKVLEFDKVGRYRVQARWQFQEETAGGFHSLELRKPYNLETWRLNGTELTLPMKGMRYLALPGIPAGLVRPGTNTLEVEWPIEVRLQNEILRPAAVEARVQLRGLVPEQLEFQTTPVVGASTPRSVSLSCRINMRGRVTLQFDGRNITSPPGLIHTFRVDGLKPDAVYPYQIRAELDNGINRTCGPFQTRTLPDGPDFTFVAMGDSRGDPKDWAAVATAAMNSRPALALFSGDMIHDGRLDGVWDRNFFAPARDYFATIPTFYVYGNHENQSPMLGEFFVPAGDARRWSIVVGSARLIGLDGGMNWTDRSENYQWLEKELAGSREKFIFVTSHYPAWTSGPHGSLNSQGRPGERPIHEAQSYLMPLFKKYQVTAMICGHDHVYERSEPGAGVSVIVTGGAGAPLYEVSANAQTQNPHSEVFVTAFHYCHFSIEGDTCRLRALTPGGQVLDEHSWRARSPGTF